MVCLGLQHEAEPEKEETKWQNGMKRQYFTICTLSG